MIPCVIITVILTLLALPVTSFVWVFGSGLHRAICGAVAEIIVLKRMGYKLEPWRVAALKRFICHWMDQSRCPYSSQPVATWYEDRDGRPCYYRYEYPRHLFSIGKLHTSERRNGA